MASTRILVNRRKAVRNIKKITRTMELIATARFKKAMDRASEAESYTRKIAELADRYSRDFIAGKIDRVQVAYMKFFSAAVQRPVVETLLPLERAADTPGAAAAKPVDYEFLPAADDILAELLPVSFKVRLFK